jgi:hypothetical protein
MSFKKLVIDNLNIARKRILMRSVTEPVSTFCIEHFTRSLLLYTEFECILMSTRNCFQSGL